MLPFARSPPVVDVSPAEAQTLLDAGTAVMLDCREDDERAEAHIPGTLHVPMGQVLARAEELPRDRVIVVQCRSGNRSRKVAAALLEAGFADARNLAGGILAWARDGRPIQRGE